MNFYVKLSDNLELRKVQSELLQKIAFDGGWRWSANKNKEIKHTQAKILHFPGCGEGRLIGFDTYSTNTLKTLLTIEEALKQLQEEEKIMIGECKVEFKGYYPQGMKDMKEGNLKCTKIVVGCVDVEKETFLKIGKKAGWI